MGKSPSNQPKVRNIRAQPISSDVHFILWNYPKYDAGNQPLDTTDLCQNPNITFLANSPIYNINSNGGPSGWTGYDTYTLSVVDGFYTKEHAENVAARWADWFELQGLIYDPNNPSQQFGEDGTRYAGGIYAQDWGSYKNGEDPKQFLFGHPDDLLWYTDEKLGTVGVPIGWHSNSCKPLNTVTYLNSLPITTTLSLGNFILWACHSLKKECDARNLCYPKYLNWDFEGNAGLYFAADSNGFVGSLVGHNGVRLGSGYVSNIFDFALEDPRFDTEVVYEEFDGLKWNGKTLFDAYTECGYDKYKNKGYTSGTSPNFVYWFQGINRDFFKNLTPYFQRINDHALHLALYQPAKIIFPDIICGNYNIHHGTSSKLTNQHFDSRNMWYRTPAKNYANKKYLRADFQSPVCYSPDLSQNRFHPSKYQSTNVIESSAPSGFYFYNAHDLGQTQQEIYNNFVIRQVTYATASFNSPTGNPIPCIPWIETPTQKTAGDAPGWTVYSATVQDINDMLEAHYGLGVRVWQVFNPSFSIDFYNNAPHIGGLNPEERADEFNNLIINFAIWVAGEPPTPPPQPNQVKSISELIAEKVHNTRCWSQFDSRAIYYKFILDNQNAAWFDKRYIPNPPTPPEFDNLGC
jgi:hypothetical protein